MSGRHQAKTQDGGTSSVNINNIPDECPQCHTKGTFSPISLYENTNKANLEVIFKCPNSRCYKVFIGYYIQNLRSSVYVLQDCKPKEYSRKEFPETIKVISSDFSEIYNQALKAESDNLDQICGPGYRKALEFLIKDYLISKAKDEKEKESILVEFLGKTIADRIINPNIKEVAKRAVWLGNDETHYVRKWNDKDLKDLKKLIDLTVHWIEAEALTEQLLEDMPEEGKTS